MQPPEWGENPHKTPSDGRPGVDRTPAREHLRRYHRSRDKVVTSAQLRLTLAVQGAIRQLSDARLEAYLSQNPSASVHDVCRELLGGLDVKCYGGTRRGYSAVYRRLRRVRSALGEAGRARGESTGSTVLPEP